MNQSKYQPLLDTRLNMHFNKAYDMNTDITVQKSRECWKLQIQLLCQHFFIREFIASSDKITYVQTTYILPL